MDIVKIESVITKEGTHLFEVSLDFRLEGNELYSSFITNETTLYATFKVGELSHVEFEFCYKLNDSDHEKVVSFLEGNKEELEKLAGYPLTIKGGMVLC